MFAALSTRLWYLQVLAAEKHKGQIFNNTVKPFDVSGLRRPILAAFKNYGPSDIVGRSGLESQYERWLRGQPGIQKYLVNAAGKRGRQLGQESPVPGSDVRLYLNLRFQRILEEKLKQGILNARH